MEAANHNSSTAPAASTAPARVADIVRKFWGFDSLRPMQEQAIHAGLSQRDSLVVLPTGGGKSLCYQVPPVVADRTDVVVSPLIALMKDQVDGLRECGYPAAALHSGLPPRTAAEIERHIASGAARLVFVSPERLLTPGFMTLVRRLNVRAFAIDEAHCISHWGHDFRPEYRRLATLKEAFPQASIHAFTATATQRVRDDIVAQLRLHDPAVLVGTFDRPNLVYRVVPRSNVRRQVLDVIRRHENQAAIVYCISRRETESMAAYLQLKDIRAEFYHAGMTPDARRRTQDAFSAEALDVVVATVAFGMGIDRSDVRCVIHAGMPKSIEHYQQEAGRAGRDGLAAECVLLYSPEDVFKWRSLMSRSVGEANLPAQVLSAAFELLDHMQRFCNSLRCRHRMLAEYFGQTYPRDDCGACDFCLHEQQEMHDGTITAQKILSCVYRVGQRFGASHVADVLRGADTERMRRFGHDKLSTYGLMKTHDSRELMSLIYQLVDSGLLERTTGDMPVLKLNDASWTVLRGERPVRLRPPKAAAVRTSRSETESWEGVDRGLFDRLRELRRTVARQQDIPAYLVFSDATLRDMARLRPCTLQQLGRVPGVGRRKRLEFGRKFAKCIADYCRENDIGPNDEPLEETHVRRTSREERRAVAFEMFAQGGTVEEVAQATGRARSTMSRWLSEYIERTQPPHIDAWVSREKYHKIEQAARYYPQDRLAPIFVHLKGAATYDEIRWVLTHLHSRRQAEAATRLRQE